MATSKHIHFNPTVTPFVPRTAVPNQVPTNIHGLPHSPVFIPQFPSAPPKQSYSQEPGHYNSTTTHPQISFVSAPHSAKIRAFSSPSIKKPTYLSALSTAVKLGTAGLFQHERDEYITNWMRFYHQGEYLRSERCHLPVKERLENLESLGRQFEEMEAEWAVVRGRRVWGGEDGGMRERQMHKRVRSRTIS
ncbi:hypothetical protein BDD12DRAFT_823309 [Trichophaea hybrida]|nr:hypothetical protein BDD12DRAFT_823309 [Trichophaea hybrida]